MPGLVGGKATLCIANYKTLDITQLCLRSIRKFTKYPYKVIVVDNDSGDGSLEYLKRLSWIHLIERSTGNDPPGSGGYAHAAAMDVGLASCNTEFFVTMHSDVFVKKNNWLDELISYFDGDETIACVGSGKIELTPQWHIILKKSTDFRTVVRKLFRQPDPVGKYRYYNRTICCLYRTDILRREKLSFLADRDKGLTSGKKLYFELVDRGYKTVELPPAVMRRYIIHLTHATQAINPQEFTLRNKTIRKCNRLVRKVLSCELMQEIINDASLDG
jgi:glycosyltransferase involved in cell wall biosynthesis